MKFLTNYPALLINRTLIISDLHIGIEYDFYRAGIKIPFQLENLKKKLEKTLKISKAKKLIIIGDVKHKVPGISKQELREIPEFFNYFYDKVEMEIVPGNHDPGIRQLLKGLEIHSNKGIKFGDYYLTHGFAWPGKEFLKCKYLITGHIHPLIEIKDKLGYKFLEQCWVRVKLDPEKLKKKYGIVKKPPELIILPAFNDLSGGKAVNTKKEKGVIGNRRFISPIANCAKMKTADIFLLDGMHLGKLGKIGFV